MWLQVVEHCDSRLKLRAGDDIDLKVFYSGARLSVVTWGPGTTFHGRLASIEWHDIVGDQVGPGVRVDDTDDFTHDVDDYAYELTVATSGCSPTAEPN